MISLRRLAIALSCLVWTGFIAGSAQAESALTFANSAISSPRAGSTAHFLTRRAPRLPVLAAACASPYQYCGNANNKPCCPGLSCLWDGVKHTSYCVRPGE